MVGSGTSVEKTLALQAVNFRFPGAVATQNKVD